MPDPDDLIQRLEALGEHYATKAPPFPAELRAAVIHRRPAWHRRWPAALAAALALIAGIFLLAHHSPVIPLPPASDPNTVIALNRALRTADPLNLPLITFPTSTAPPSFAGDLRPSSRNYLGLDQ